MFELIIIGAGPAGLTASIYASRYRLKNLVLGKVLGGTASEASSVENYPGFPKISGMDLMQKMSEQAKKLGAEVKQEEVFEIKKEKDKFKVKTKNGNNYEAKSLILACGTQRRQLNIPGETEFVGRGVSYCATCDAAFFKGKEVAVIGGGNAAATASLHCAEFSKRVYLIVRENKMMADPIWQEKIKANKKIEVIYKTNLIEIKGQNTLSEIILDNPYQNSNVLKVSGIFVEIGSVPASALAKGLGVQFNEAGFIKVKEDMSTNIEGIFSAGDITDGSANLRQIITACSEGAIAATSAYNYLKEKAS